MSNLKKERRSFKYVFLEEKYEKTREKTRNKLLFT